ncbi:MAG: type II toxin-antitoxin system VapC family toxin [Cyanobacteria bacterium J06621_8]
MIGIDTNVVVRYLTKDDEIPWQKAVDIINQSESYFICNVVLCEIFWVLKGKSYKYSPAEIIKAFELMLQSPKFEFENRSTTYQAIAMTKKGTADFADYLIGTVNYENGCIHTVTLDRKLKTAKRYELLD